MLSYDKMLLLILSTVDSRLLAFAAVDAGCFVVLLMLLASKGVLSELLVLPVLFASIMLLSGLLLVFAEFNDDDDNGFSIFPCVQSREQS